MMSSVGRTIWECAIDHTGGGHRAYSGFTGNVCDCWVTGRPFQQNFPVDKANQNLL
jgi:hypothetical protein